MESYKLGKKSIKMPSNWQEVTYEKGLKILEGGLDQVEILALLTDSTTKQIRKATDIQTIYYFTNTFLFLQKPPQKINEFPRSVQMGADRIIFPFISYANKFDLGKCEVGQVEDMIAILTRESQYAIKEEDRLLSEIEMIKITPFLTAIYIQKILDGFYDGDRAMDLMPRIKKELSMKEVVSMGYFFLTRLNAYNNGQSGKLQKPYSILRRLKLVFLNSIQRLVSMLP